MSSGQMTDQAAPVATGGVRPTDDHIAALGKLSFLAAFCPLHRTYPGHALASIFFPAINNGCVRFFEDENGGTAAALIWARLSDEVSERMLFESIPPTSDEWASGTNLWFLDILAPFGHGRTVAKHIARNPPPGPFYFARLGKDGAVRKVVEGDPTQGGRGRVKSFLIEAEAV